MATIYIENLSNEYRRKLCDRKMKEDEIALLATEISKKYFFHKKGYRLAIILVPSITILCGVMSFFSPAARQQNMTVIMGCFVFALLMEMLALLIVRSISVTRVPKQYAKCLNEGYPELNEAYGYKKIIDGSLLSNEK